MKQGNGYIVGFAAGICIVCSLLLSVIAGSLAGKQEENRVLDKRKNILLAAGVSRDQVGKMSAAEVQTTYDAKLEELVINTAGDVVEGKKPSDLDAKDQSGESRSPKLLPLFRQKDEAGKTVGYIYPVTGKGLWSTMYGYLAVKPDGSEVVGVAFYKHGETPGLGAEIEQPWFTSSFVGKQIYKDGKIEGIEVVKGKVADKTGIDTNHAVDGMSGATLTGNGVTKMSKTEPAKYDAFFKKSGGQR
jgi:Na+-transporting NADH:ubiquinone oxidoreductase subunit C